MGKFDIKHFEPGSFSGSVNMCYATEQLNGVYYLHVGGIALLFAVAYQQILARLEWETLTADHGLYMYRIRTQLIREVIMRKVKIVTALILFLIFGFFIPYVYSSIQGNYAISVIDPSSSIQYHTCIGDNTNGMWVNVEDGHGKRDS